MSLNDKLREAVVEDLSNLRLFFFDNYVQRHAGTFSALREQGVINEQDVQEALKVVVLREARAAYDLMTKKDAPYTTYADHVGRPECLAYALKQGEFSRAEIAKIPFDHGQTAQTFPERYGKPNLLCDLATELLYPCTVYNTPV